MEYLVAILIALPVVIGMSIAGYSMAAPQFGWSTQGWKHWYYITIAWTGIAMVFVAEAFFSGRIKQHCQQGGVNCGFDKGNHFWHAAGEDGKKKAVTVVTGNEQAKPPP